MTNTFRKGLMTHIVGGYPTMNECENLALAMAGAGVGYIEIQIPFSDPIADGPTILKANQVALENGTTPKDCMELMKKLSSEIETPLIFMTYYNIVFNYGVEKFCKDAKEAGAWGFIVPDIPLDEEDRERFLENCKKYGLNAVQVISPITPNERLVKIAEVASGLIYCVSRKGTTGVRQEMSENLGVYIERVKKFIDLPIAVGFGISSKEHVDIIHEHAEVAVIGSKIMRIHEKGGIEAVNQFIQSLI